MSAGGRGEREAGAEEPPGRRAALYEAKIRVELADADAAAGADGASWAGDPLSSVLVVKAEAGPAERAGKPPFSAEDGEALRKALAALDLGAGFLGVFAGVGAGTGSVTDGSRATARLATQLAAVDPAYVVAADPTAAPLVAEALGVAVPAFGACVGVGRRRFVVLEGFEGALADAEAKKRVWQQLRALVAEPWSAGGAKGGARPGRKS